jgi:hypothetical protein
MRMSPRARDSEEEDRSIKGEDGHPGHVRHPLGGLVVRTFQEVKKRLATVCAKSPSLLTP